VTAGGFVAAGPVGHRVADQVVGTAGGFVAAGPVAHRLADEVVVGTAGGGVGVAAAAAAAGHVDVTNYQQIHGPSAEGRLSVRTVRVDDVDPRRVGVDARVGRTNHGLPDEGLRLDDVDPGRVGVGYGVGRTNHGLPDEGLR